MAHCHDPEGWRVSHISGFDTTPCFEEGIVLSGLLTGVLVLCLLRSLELGFLAFDAERKTPKSLWVLKGKVALLVAGTAVSAANIIQILLQKLSVPSCSTMLSSRLRFSSLRYSLGSTTLEPVDLRLFSYVLATLHHHPSRLDTNTVALGRPGQFRRPVHVKMDYYRTWVCAFALECLGSEFGLKQFMTQGRFLESPLLTANIYSRWAFGWMTPLMKKGSEQFITEKDLPSLPPDDSAAALGNKLRDVMKRQFRKPYSRLRTGFPDVPASMLQTVTLNQVCLNSIWYLRAYCGWFVSTSNVASRPVCVFARSCDGNIAKALVLSNGSRAERPETLSTLCQSTRRGCKTYVPMD
ncbi:Metal resistance protein [Salix suchowensis]|nr:Metal resistance protein [Salix suchowensis]